MIARSSVTRVAASTSIAREDTTPALATDRFDVRCRADGPVLRSDVVSVLARIPFHPLLLAAYAVLFVYAANIGEVVPRDLVRPLALAVVAALIVLAIASLLLRDARRGAVIATAVVLVVGYFGHVATTVVDLGVTEPLLLAIAAGLIVLAILYAILARGSLPGVTTGLNVFALLLVLISLVTIVPFETGRVARASEATPGGGEPIATATRHPNRDIYLVVFDRYGSDWSIKERFGIDNDLYPDLEAVGFQVIPGARSTYRATDFSIATMLSMNRLDDLSESVGRSSGDRTPARARLLDHEVGRFLKANGYRYDHVSAWYEPTFDNPIADEVMRYGKTTEFESVLDRATILPRIRELVEEPPVDDEFRDRHRNEALFAFRALERIADDPALTFTFAHILLPHPPYGFGEGGRIVLSAEEKSRPEGELYAQQLAYTNDRIRELVAKLLEGPDETDPIVVLTGDEGPFLCFNVDCIDGSPETYGIRFGALRAYYLPGLDYTVPPDDTGVNIFRMILREYFGADLPDLPNRSFDYPDNDHTYDFFDITDQLPLPGG
jgi:hypothetical protein